MTIVRHILAKDLRRLRWLLLAWLVVVFSRVAVTAARSDLAFDDFTRQLALDNVSGLLMFVDMPMLALLVSLLGPSKVAPRQHSASSIASNVTRRDRRSAQRPGSMPPGWRMRIWR
jgi:hypothetical protein